MKLLLYTNSKNQSNLGKVDISIKFGQSGHFLDFALVMLALVMLLRK